jgi:hypothetical protein
MFKKKKKANCGFYQGNLNTFFGCLEYGILFLKTAPLPLSQAKF